MRGLAISLEIVVFGCVINEMVSGEFAASMAFHDHAERIGGANAR